MGMVFRGYHIAVAQNVRAQDPAKMAMISMRRCSTGRTSRCSGRVMLK